MRKPSLEAFVIQLRQGKAEWGGGILNMSSIQHGMALADSYVAKCDGTVSGGPNGEEILDWLDKYQGPVR